LSEVAVTLVASTWSRVTSPFTVSAVTSPALLISSTSAFTECTSRRPFAPVRLTLPWTERSDTRPSPPVAVTSPCTVSAEIAARVPVTVISVFTPERSSGIQAGAVIRRSTSDGGPRRPEVRTDTVVALRSISTPVLPSVSAWTRTASRFQTDTVTSPAKAFTSSRWPRPTGTVESICWSSASSSSTSGSFQLVAATRAAA
jgi:hypothetical protein